MVGNPKQNEINLKNYVFGNNARITNQRFFYKNYLAFLCIGMTGIYKYIFNA